MEVTGEMEVDLVHGQDLRVTSSACTAFLSEARSERGFTECDDGFFADAVESESETYAHCCLSDAGLSGVDGGD